MILTNFKVNVNERVGEMLRFVKIPIQIVFSPYLILSEALLLLAESICIWKQKSVWHHLTPNILR